MENTSKIKHIYVMLTPKYVLAYRPHPQDPIRLYADREDMIPFIIYMAKNFREHTIRAIRNPGLEEHLLKAIENDKKFEKTCFRPAEFEMENGKKLKIKFDNTKLSVDKQR